MKREQHFPFNRLDAYLEGALPAAEQAQLAAHLQQCAACQAQLAAEMAFIEQLRQAGPPPHILTPAQSQAIRQNVYRHLRRSMIMNKISLSLGYAVGFLLFVLVLGLFVWWQQGEFEVAAPEVVLTPTAVSPLAVTPTPMQPAATRTVTAVPPLPTATLTPTAGAQPVSATYFVLPQYKEVAQQLAHHFHEAHPHSQIIIGDQVPQADGFSDVALAQQYDCFLSGSASVNERLHPYVMPLDAFLTDQDADLLANMPPELLAANRHEGGLLALPAAILPQVIYYNASHLAALGLEPPAPDWTVNDFWELAAGTAVDLNAIYGFTTANLAGADGLAFLLADSGSHYYQASPLQVNFDDPALVELLRHLAAMTETGVLYPLDMGGSRSYAGNRSEMGSDLRLGRIIFWVNRAGLPYGFERPLAAAPPRFEVDVAPLPATLPLSPYHSLAHYISRQAAEPAVCWQWITFLAHQPHDLYPGLPVNQAVIASEEWAEAVGPQRAAVYRAVWQGLEFTAERPLFVPSPFSQWWEDAQAAVLLEGADPALVLAQTQAKAAATLTCMTENELDPADPSWDTAQAIADCARQVDPDYQTREELGGFIWQGAVPLVPTSP